MKQFQDRLAEERHSRLEERKKQRKEERRIAYYREKEEEEERLREEQMLKGKIKTLGLNDQTRIVSLLEPPPKLTRSVLGCPIPSSWRQFLSD